MYVFTLSESRYIDPSGGAWPARGRPLTHLGNLELKRILFQLRCVNRTPLCSFIETEQTPAEPQRELLMSKVFCFCIKKARVYRYAPMGPNIFPPQRISAAALHELCTTRRLYISTRAAFTGKIKTRVNTPLILQKSEISIAKRF